MPFKYSDFLSNQLSPLVLQEITYLGADEAPLHAALRSKGVQPTPTARFEWDTQAAVARTTAIDNGGSAYDETTTSVVVDDASIFRATGLAYCEATGEVILITGVTVATNTLTIVRGVGGTTAAAGSVANNAVIRSLGGAFGEGSDAPTERVWTSTSVHNFVQTFRESVKLTGTAMATKTLTTPEELARQRELAFRKINEDIEQSLIFGVKSNDEVDASGNPVYTTDGLWSVITENVSSAVGTLTEAALDAWAEKLFAISSNPKMTFAGATFLRAIRNVYKDDIRRVDSQTVVGLGPIEVVRTTFGELHLTWDRALKGSFAGSALAIDVDNAGLRAMEGRDMQLREDIQDKKTDAKMDEYFAQLGLWYRSELYHGRMSGVTG